MELLCGCNKALGDVKREPGPGMKLEGFLRKKVDGMRDVTFQSKECSYNFPTAFSYLGLKSG